MRQICSFIFLGFLLLTKRGEAQEAASFGTSAINGQFMRNNTADPDTAIFSGDSVHPLQPVEVHSRSWSSQMSGIQPRQQLSNKNSSWQNALSVADAVRYFSGVQLKDYGGVGGLKTINVRSMGANHMAILMNGIPLENMQNGQVDLGKYSMDNLSSITLFNGQHSSIFQPARAFASGSALYLESRTADLDTSHHSRSNISLKAGSFGLWSPSVYTAHKLNQYWTVSFQASGLFTKGNYPFRYTNAVYDTTLKRDNGDVKSYHANVDLEGQFKDSSRLRIQAYGFRRQMGLPGAIVSNRFINQERQDETNYFIQGDYHKPIGKKDQLRILFKYNKDYLTYRNPEIQRLYLRDGDTLTGPLINHYRQTAYYGSIANLYQISSNWQASIALDLVHDLLFTDLYGFATPSRWTAYLAAATRLNLGPLEIEGNLLATDVTDKAKAANAATSKREWTPGLSFAWQPFKRSGFKLRGFYKRLFRMPTFNDLYYTQIGNITLRPEYVDEYDLGINYTRSFNGQIKTIYFQIDGYYNRIKDKIVAIPTTSLFRWQMTNLGKVRILGLDFSGHADFRWNQIQMMTALNYTYQKAQDITNPLAANYKGQIPYIPEHSGSLVIDLAYQKWNFKYSFLYDGERYSQTYNSLENYVPAWYTHDLALFYKHPLGKETTLQLSLALDNILNQHYDVILNYPMPGRNFKMGAAVNF